MLQARRILCPTDMSEPANHALGKAIEIARHFDAELLLLHVVPSVPVLLPGPGFVAFPVEGYEKALEEEARKKLHEIEGRIPAGVKFQTIVRHGDAANQILLSAEELKVDLVVIASHGMTGFHHFIFGSVTEKVVKFLHQPILVLRPPHGDRV